MYSVPVPVHVVQHPLVQDALVTLRDARTSPETFRRTATRVSVLLAAEAMRDLPTAARVVDTPLGPAEGWTVTGDVVVVPVLRAGLGMLDAVLGLVPGARVGHLGLQRGQAAVTRQGLGDDMLAQVRHDVDPDRVDQVQRQLGELAAQRRRMRQALLQMLAQGVDPLPAEARGQLEHMQRAHMHGHLGGFEMQKQRVEAGYGAHRVSQEGSGRQSRLDHDHFLSRLGPGLVLRAQLGEHHIWFLSHCGPDVESNKTALCFMHHIILLHGLLAAISVSGTAPDELEWRIGRSPGEPPLLVFRGNRKIDPMADFESGTGTTTFVREGSESSTPQPAIPMPVNESALTNA